MTTSFFHLMLIITLSLPLIACEYTPNTHNTPPHKLNPPTPADNAKIAITKDSITLAKAHVMSIKSELYQPAFRLEGTIIPQKQINVTTPQEGKLDRLLLKTGDVSKKGSIVAHFYQESILPPPPNTDDDDSDNSDDDNDKKTPHHSSTNKDHTNDTMPANDKSHDKDDNDTDNTKTTPIIKREPFVAVSLMSGKVGEVFIHDKNTVYPKDTPILTIYDDHAVKFISTLPKSFGEILAVGDGVSLHVHRDVNSEQTFSGQIEQIHPHTKNANLIEIHVLIKPDEIKKAKLSLGEFVSGSVSYGQIDVGILVPDFAIFEDTGESLVPMDLSDLTQPPYKPTAPRPAWLWEVGQDEHLSLMPIKVIEYRPDSKQFLIAGVKLDGLIVLANLPKTAHGARVRLR